MLIDIDNPSTFPKEIENTVYSYISNMPISVSDEISNSCVEFSIDVTCAIEKYMGLYKADALYDRVLATLERHSFIGFHGTKIICTDGISDYGLYTNNWQRYKIILENNLKQLSFCDVDISKALDLVKREYCRKYIDMKRTSQLCFCSSLRMFQGDRCSRGYDQFCESIGGELAKCSLEERMPDIYKALKDNGNAVIVKFAIPFADIVEHDKDPIAFKFISYYASKHYWVFSYDMSFDSSTQKDVAPDRILDIIPVKGNGLVKTTGGIDRC